MGLENRIGDKMNIIVRKFKEKDVFDMIDIWNEVVTEGNAFPQKNKLTKENAKTFFEGQEFCGVAEYNNEILGIYILHPNNVGRCGHIANASYAVRGNSHGQQGHPHRDLRRIHGDLRRGGAQHNRIRRGGRDRTVQRRQRDVRN